MPTLKTPRPAKRRKPVKERAVILRPPLYWRNRQALGPCLLLQYNGHALAPCPTCAALRQASIDEGERFSPGCETGNGAR